MSGNGISIDNSDLTAMAAGSEIEDWLTEEAEGILSDIYVDLTSPPPVGTPFKSGAARLSWQLDLDAKEVFTESPYMNRLNDGSSKQSPSGFIDAIVDRHTDT